MDEKKAVTNEEILKMQICVWEGCVVTPDQDDFTAFFKKELGVDVYFLEEVTTLPDKCPHGHAVPETGGRIDTFFAVNLDNISEDRVCTFSLARMKMGIRWWEDVLGNKHEGIYPKEILVKYPPKWNHENINSPEGNLGELKRSGIGIEDLEVCQVDKDLIN